MVTVNAYSITGWMSRQEKDKYIGRMGLLERRYMQVIKFFKKEKKYQGVLPFSGSISFRRPMKLVLDTRIASTIEMYGLMVMPVKSISWETGGNVVEARIQHPAGEETAVTLLSTLFVLDPKLIAAFQRGELTVSPRVKALYRTITSVQGKFNIKPKTPSLGEEPWMRVPNKLRIIARGFADVPRAMAFLYSGNTVLVGSEDISRLVRGELRRTYLGLEIAGERCKQVFSNTLGYIEKFFDGILSAIQYVQAVI